MLEIHWRLIMAIGKKKRKPMTAEQRVAAGKRLALARAKKKPAQYKSVHPKVRALDDDNDFSIVSIKRYIKATTEKISNLKKAVRLNEKGAIAKLASAQAYKRHCEQYLKDGIWSLDFIGENEELRVVWGTLAPAYDENGIQKVQNART